MSPLVPPLSGRPVNELSVSLPARQREWREDTPEARSSIFSIMRTYVHIPTSLCIIRNSPRLLHAKVVPSLPVNQSIVTLISYTDCLPNLYLTRIPTGFTHTTSPRITRPQQQPPITPHYATVCSHPDHSVSLEHSIPAIFQQLATHPREQVSSFFPAHDDRQALADLISASDSPPGPHP